MKRAALPGPVGALLIGAIMGLVAAVPTSLLLVALKRGRDCGAMPRGE